jgi:hypothetical protein
MLMMLLIGWVAVLPAVVVTGLYLGGRRRDRRAPESVDFEAITAFAVKGRRTESPREPAPLIGARSGGY